jgi:hypothetical protein
VSVTVSSVKDVGGSRRLPAQELIVVGLRDLESGVESVEALLVSIGRPRLARAGLSVAAPIPAPEHRLYRLLSERYGDAAHSRYNALVRRLVSFERAAVSPPHA